MAKPTKLKCLRCKFKWTPKGEEMPKVCPYCGKEECIVIDGDAKFDDLERFFK